MLKYTVFFTATLFIWSSAFGQTDQTKLPQNRKSKIPICNAIYTAEKVDNEVEIIASEENRALEGDKMMRFGKELDINLNFKEMAQVSVLPNGRKIYQLGIACQTAKSINLILSDFHLAEGANLFLTDRYSNNFIGAYTAANNNDAGVIGTELLKTESVILVLDEPNIATEPSHFNITTIVHGFEDLDILVKGLNTSGDCNYDVNCPEGLGYEQQRNSVAMMVNGGGFCTGSLVNNTSGTIKPYFLSARHCGTNPTNWVFRFRWESPSSGISCGTTGVSADGPSNMNVNGGVLTATNSTSDFVLVRLNTAPNPAWGVFYNGWDNSDSLTATKGIGIHHPDGDIKKISIENEALSQQTINFQSAQNRTWRIANWDVGVTEPGSSGSPLFNQEKRLIGVLSGGTAACSGTNDNNEPDFYGRFGYAWDNSTSASGRLNDWLDSTGTGATVIDGVDPFIGNDLVDASLTTLAGFPASNCDSLATPQFSLLNSGTNVLTTVQLTYGFVGGTPQNYTWTGNLATYGQALIVLPSIVVPIGTSTFEVNVISANGAVDLDISNNVLNKPVYRTPSDFTALLSIDYDCYASETTWEVRNSAGIAVYSGGPFEDDTQGTVNYDLCLAFGCYDMIIRDSYGDGLSGCSAGAGGNGSYKLTLNATNETLAELLEADANFGMESIKEFCYPFLGISEINLKNLITLYPNPGASALNIKSKELKLQSVHIYSLTGKEVMNVSVSGNDVELNTTDLPASFYLVKIATDKGELNQRWIKQ